VRVRTLKWEKTGNYCVDRMVATKYPHYYFRYFVIHLASDDSVYVRNCGRCRDTPNRHPCISRAVRFIQLKGFGIWLFDTFVSRRSTFSSFPSKFVYKCAWIRPVRYPQRE